MRKLQKESDGPSAPALTVGAQALPSVTEQGKDTAADMEVEPQPTTAAGSPVSASAMSACSTSMSAVSRQSPFVAFLLRLPGSLVLTMSLFHYMTASAVSICP